MVIELFLYAPLSYGMNCLFSCACRQIYKHLNQDCRQCFLKWPIFRWAFALLFFHIVMYFLLFSIFSCDGVRCDQLLFLKLYLIVEIIIVG